MDLVSVVAPIKFMKLEHIGVLYFVTDIFDNWFFTMSLLISKCLLKNFNRKMLLWLLANWGFKPKLSESRGKMVSYM